MLIYCTVALIATEMIGAAMDTDSMEFVNPIYLYNRFKVNWFGAILMFLFFNVLTLPFAICYWVYKLCTVGRN